MVEAVIVSTARTPIGRATRGAFNLTHGAEMGAWNWLRQPTRLARVGIVVDEMLPAGVAASIRYCN